ncbi:MAG TPA: hypothetical protein VFU63_07640 [Ktedonobacterales bacterium]|nr:hypothetical protein [Ktedonobacterales bacterium]
MADDSSNQTDELPMPDESEELREPEPPDEGSDAEDGEKSLVSVRYGLGKELQLYPDAFVIAHLEEHTEMRFTLANIRRMILAPGDPNPSKLVLMFELDDGNVVIAAEGMSNVRDFRKLLPELQRVAPTIELDPPDMDTQLAQALDIRKRSLFGCYGVVIGACILAWVLYFVIAFIGARAH